MTDSLGLLDAAARQAEHSRSALDTVTLAAAATRLTAVARGCIDALMVTDVLSHGAAAARSFAHSLILGDAALRSMASVRAVGDVFSVAAAVDRALVYGRLADHAVLLTSASTREVASARLSADSLALGATAAVVSDLMRSWGDVVTLADQPGVAQAYSRDAWDALTLEATHTAPCWSQNAA